MTGENSKADHRRRFPAFPLILTLSVVLNLTGIWWGLPTDHSWAPDELFPQRVLTGLESRFAHGWYDNYPPVHYYILSVLYAPFLLLDKAKALDHGAVLLYYLGRLLSVLMAAGCLVLVYRVGREIFDRRAALFASLITALIVPFPYYAKTANLDVPYLFWFLWSLFSLVRILKTQRAGYYLLFALTAVLSICTKDQAYGLYVLAPALVVWADRRAARAAGDAQPFLLSLFKMKYTVMAAVGAGTFALAHNLLFNWSGFIQHVRLILGPASQDFKMFPATFSGQLKLIGLTFKEIRFCLGWPLVIVCLLGLGLALLERPRNFNALVLPLFGLSYYVFYIAIIRYNYDRFNLPFCILLSLFGGKAISTLIGARPPWPAVAKTVAVAAFAYSFSLAASVDVLMVKDSRYNVERWLHAHVPGGTKVGFVGLPNYLPRLDGYARRPVPASLPAFERADKPDFLVFNSGYASRFPAESEEGRFFAGFPMTDPGYQPAYRYQTPLGWLPLRPGAPTRTWPSSTPRCRSIKKRPPAGE